MTKKEKAVKFVKEHKKEILLTGVSAVGGAVAYKVTRDRRIAKRAKEFIFKENLARFMQLSDISNISWGNVSGGFEYKLADFGRVGEDILASTKDVRVTPDTVVTGGIVFGKL